MKITIEQEQALIAMMRLNGIIAVVAGLASILYDEDNANRLPVSVDDSTGAEIHKSRGDVYAVAHRLRFAAEEAEM